MRKVLYLSLKEFRSAQKRQLEDGTPNSNGKLAHAFPGPVGLVFGVFPLVSSVEPSRSECFHLARSLWTSRNPHLALALRGLYSRADTTKDKEEHNEREAGFFLVFVQHWNIQAKKKNNPEPSSSELHTCFRSYSQLTLTQPRHLTAQKRSADRKAFCFEI